MFFLLFSTYKCVGLFLPTKFDPLINQSTDQSALVKEIFENKFDVTTAGPESHKMSPSRIGELSFITFNLYTDRLSKADNQTFNDSLLQLLNGSHASIIALQSVPEKIMKELEKRVGKHYMMINTEKHDIDRKTNRRMHLPILFDRNILQLEKKGFFTRNGKSNTPFASYALFKYGFTRFAVVNMDIYEAENKKTNLLFYKILSDIKQSGFAGSVYLLGYISQLTDNIESTIRDRYSNLITKDRNNERLSLTTVHGGNENDDNVQRDFILLNDIGNTFRLNYSRILSGLKIGQHYPVHAILTLGATAEQRKMMQRNQVINKQRMEVAAQQKQRK